jgi:hypothetical protein
MIMQSTATTNLQIVVAVILTLRIKAMLRRDRLPKLE